MIYDGSGVLPAMYCTRDTIYHQWVYMSEYCVPYREHTSHNGVKCKCSAFSQVVTHLYSRISSQLLGWILISEWVRILRCLYLVSLVILIWINMHTFNYIMILCVVNIGRSANTSATANFNTRAMLVNYETNQLISLVKHPHYSKYHKYWLHFFILCTMKKPLSFTSASFRPSIFHLFMLTINLNPVIFGQLFK